MLEETRKIYEQSADAFVPNWRELDRNEIIKKAAYLKNGPERDGYVGAIMCIYWSKIPKFYNMCKLVTTPEEIHMWLTIAVLYALNKKPWDNPNGTIYGDPSGPDKVINRVMASHRITFYQQLNRYNRKINSNTISLNSLTDDFKDLFIPTTSDKYTLETDELVFDYFNKKDYFMAFMVDAIINENVVDSGLNRKRLASHFRRLDEDFCKRFSKMYGIDLELVKDSIKYVNNLSNYKFNNNVEYGIVKLNKYFSI